ncbi:hypothetical protein HC891_12740 [Candidatus Gracilibacteria bacterium]|nr:hypothetical protein [Candidatus Gracilibacteria bacterium]
MTLSNLPADYDLVLASNQDDIENGLNGLEDVLDTGGSINAIGGSIKAIGGSIKAIGGSIKAIGGSIKAMAVASRRSVPTSAVRTRRSRPFSGSPASTIWPSPARTGPAILRPSTAWKSLFSAASCKSRRPPPRCASEI